MIKKAETQSVSVFSLTFYTISGILMRFQPQVTLLALSGGKVQEIKNEVVRMSDGLAVTRTSEKLTSRH